MLNVITVNTSLDSCYLESKLDVLFNNAHLMVLFVVPEKKLSSSFITKSDLSSGIKCPEFGTLIPCTF
jgi:hypothetical protein